MKMKRILIIIILFVFTAASCTDNQGSQNYLSEPEENIFDLFDGKNAETVLRFENSFDEGKLRDIIFTYDWLCDDENEKSSIIKTYLQEYDMFKETPDNIIYGGEYFFIEYYAHSDKRKTSFIIYFGDEPDKFDNIYCITYSWDDLKESGYIVYDNNQDGDAVYEILYDAEGEQKANISYEYFDNIPFNFITEYEHSSDDLIFDILNRNQKFWFYKNQTVFDETGKATGMNDDIQSSYNRSDYRRFNEFLYDEKDRLKEIREHFSEEEKIHMPDYIDLDYEVDFAGQISFDYYDNDKLKAVDYRFFYYNHGTTDSSGLIRYDEQGRMIYRSYYITHGRHYCIYLYEGESKRPRVCFEFCIMAHSVEDNYVYGNETYVNIFQDK